MALPPCNEWEEIIKFQDQGHTVVLLEKIDNGFRTNIEVNEDVISLLLEADVVLGAKAWRMNHQHRQYLPLAIKEARVLKYPTYEERASSKNRAKATVDLDISVDAESIPSEEPSE